MTADANIQIGIRKVGQGDKVIKRDLDQISKKADTATKSTKLLGRALSGAFAIGFLRTFSRVSDEFKLLEARIKNSTRSTQEFEKAFKDLRDVSAQTGASFRSAVEVFQRLSFVRDEISATSDEMVAFTANVQKLGVVSGASGASLTAGLTQLGQGLSSGVLRAEEFNSVLENVPAIAVSIADELGVTTGQLRNLVLEGEVLSKDVFAAILNQTESINAEFEKFPQTIGRAFNNLILEVKDTTAEIDKASNASRIFIAVLDKAGDVVGILSGLAVGFANTFKAAMTAAVTLVLSLFQKIADAFQFVINTAIQGINLIKKEDIGLLDLKLDIEGIQGAANEDILDSLGKAGGGFKDGFESLGDLFGADLGVNTTRESGGSVVREISKDYSELAKNLGETAKKTGKLSQAQREYEKELKRVKELEKERANEIGDILFDLGRGYTSLRDVAIQALDDILRSMLRLNQGGTAVDGIFGSIGDAIFGGLGGLFGGGSSAPIPARKPVGFATGGSFRVGGTGGTDSQLVQFMATPSEMVEVSKNGQGSSGKSQTVYNIDARGAQAGVENKIKQALFEVDRLRKETPTIAINAVTDANNRNLRFLS